MESTFARRATAGRPVVEVTGGSAIRIPPPANNFGTTIDVLCCVGPPMVNTDGTAYLEYEDRNTVNDVVTSDTLYLMQIRIIPRAPRS
ncbi:MAG: hypothetical protein WBV55_01150 [Candidatus Sulfotelmatobacter sp.]